MVWPKRTQSSRDNNGRDASLHKQYTTITDEVHLYAFFTGTLLLEYKM